MLIKLSGSLGKVLEKIQDNTLEIQSQLEASIDFPEDDISDPDYSELINKLTDLIQRLDDLIRNHSLEKKILMQLRITLIRRLMQVKVVYLISYFPKIGRL